VNAVAALKGMGVVPTELGLPKPWFHVLDGALENWRGRGTHISRTYLGLFVVTDRRLTVYSAPHYGRFIVLEDPLQDQAQGPMFNIMLNGRSLKIPSATLSYEGIMALLGEKPTRFLRVHYTSPRREDGSFEQREIKPGESVDLEDGAMINTPLV
jgi:hypothetical protein